MRVTPLNGSDGKVGAWMCVFVPASSNVIGHESLAEEDGSDGLKEKTEKSWVENSVVDEERLSMPKSAVDDMEREWLDQAVRPANSTVREKKISERPACGENGSTYDDNNNLHRKMDDSQISKIEHCSSCKAVEAWLDGRISPDRPTSWVYANHRKETPPSTEKRTQEVTDRQYHGKRLTQLPYQTIPSRFPTRTELSQSPLRMQEKRFNHISSSSNTQPCVNYDNYPAQFDGVPSRKPVPILQPPTPPTVHDPLRSPTTCTIVQQFPLPPSRGRISSVNTLLSPTHTSSSARHPRRFPLTNPDRCAERQKPLPSFPSDTSRLARSYPTPRMAYEHSMLTDDDDALSVRLASARSSIRYHVAARTSSPSSARGLRPSGLTVEGTRRKSESQPLLCRGLGSGVARSLSNWCGHGDGEGSDGANRINAAAAVNAKGHKPRRSSRGVGGKGRKTRLERKSSSVRAVVCAMANSVRRRMGQRGGGGGSCMRGG